MRKRNIKKTKNGFSLMEVMISIGVISVGIVSILNLFSSSFKAQVKANNKLIAVYLAQEGIEVVRQIRDSNWKTGSPSWDTGITDVSEGDKVIGFKTCDGSSCTIEDGFEILDRDANNQIVYQDTSDNYYGQFGNNASFPSSWTSTGFARWLNIQKVKYDLAAGPPNYATANPDYMQVISYVAYDGVVIAQVRAYLNKWK